MTLLLHLPHTTVPSGFFLPSSGPSMNPHSGHTTCPTFDTAGKTVRLLSGNLLAPTRRMEMERRFMKIFRMRQPPKSKAGTPKMYMDVAVCQRIALAGPKVELAARSVRYKA